MGLTAENYRNKLLTLLPVGVAWARDANSTMADMLHAWADELARVDGRTTDLRNEADPQTTLELILEWESILGIPDPCSGLGETLQQRREAILAALRLLGGQSRQYFIDLAATLGFEGATITEYDPHSVDLSVDAGLFGDDWQFAWTLSVAMPDVQQISVDSSVDESMGEQSSTTRLECMINRYKPAHTIALFEYT